MIDFNPGLRRLGNQRNRSRERAVVCERDREHPPLLGVPDELSYTREPAAQGVVRVRV